ncbi:FecCD family ABC transporter permease [Rhizobium helianthi]|uniref:FecCD family ABC transporter permease n=1 Tax=Rhizobium helianthi TaxID=1132695 RepID=A0ABW4M0Z7_9HYPH
MTAVALRRKGPPIGTLLLIFAVMLTSPVVAVLLGVVDIPLVDIMAVFDGTASREVHSIIWDMRVPRVLVGGLAGIHLAVAGLILQNVTKNPLADPSIMGISQGATLAVSLFLLLSVYIQYTGTTTVPELPLEWLPTIGVLGGAAAGGLIYLLAFRTELGPLRITLCGIAVGAVFHAVAIGLIAGWGSNRLDVLLEWLSGSLYARSWEHLVFLLPYTVIGLALLPLIRRPLELLRLDSAVAQSFGLSYRKQFTLALFLSCLLASSAVATVGPIVFVGLVVPHLARYAAGNRTTLILPLTIALGAIIVTLGDLTGRVLGQAEEIPIGVITAIFGVPVLIFLLRKSP